MYTNSIFEVSVLNTDYARLCTLNTFYTFSLAYRKFNINRKIIDIINLVYNRFSNTMLYLSNLKYPNLTGQNNMDQ